MQDRVRKQDLEDLSAWLDGELEDERAAEVEKAVSSDPALGEAYRRMCRLDDLLGSFTAPPPPVGLAERIIANVRRARRRPLVVRVLRYLAPAAAAAGIIVAIALFANRVPRTSTPSEQSGLQDTATARIDGAEAVAKASFFADFYVLENFETLEAIETLESQQ